MALRIIKQIENTWQSKSKPSWYITYLVECDRCLKQFNVLKKNLKKRQYCPSCTMSIVKTKPIEERKRKPPQKHLHHMHWTHFYKKWTSMIWRCNYKTVHWYKNYWGRWIKCEWEKFEDFYKDMYDSYLEHYNIHWEDTTLDRIDTNGNYNKDNCRWLTMKEQQANKRCNHKTVYNWVEYPSLKSLCEEKWLKYWTINRRLFVYKWDLNKAIETP